MEKAKGKTHVTSYPLQWFLYKMVSDFLPANSQNRLNGMDKALTEGHPKENTLTQMGNKGICPIFKLCVGRGVSTFEVCSLHDNLPVALLSESELPSKMREATQTNQISFKLSRHSLVL